MSDATCLQLRSAKSGSACPCPKCRLLCLCMLRVFKAYSGEEILAIVFTQCLVGQRRFKQRLVRSDGQLLADDLVRQGPMDLHLILRPFEASSKDQIWQLQQTARHNNTRVLEHLLQRPQDPDLEGADGWVALHLACSRGCTEAVHLLLEASADKDKAGNDDATPLLIASQHGHVDVVRLLLEASADKDKTRNDDVTNGVTSSFLALSLSALAASNTRTTSKCPCCLREMDTGKPCACCWRPMLTTTRPLVMVQHHC